MGVREGYTPPEQLGTSRETGTEIYFRKRATDFRKAGVRAVGASCSGTQIATLPGRAVETDGAIESDPAVRWETRGIEMPGLMVREFGLPGLVPRSGILALHFAGNSPA